MDLINYSQDSLFDAFLDMGLGQDSKIVCDETDKIKN